MTKYYLLILALLCMGPACAEVYKWKDQNGVTHYGDDPRAAGQGAAPVKSKPATAPAAAPAAASAAPPGDWGLIKPYDFNGLPVATIAQCMRYARQAAEADRDFDPNASGNTAEPMRRIEATCPGVAFHCYTDRTNSRESFCQPVLRSEQKTLVRHEWSACSLSCNKSR